MRFQSILEGSTSRPPILMRRLWRSRTAVFQPPPPNQPPSSRRIGPDLFGLDRVRHVPIGIEHDLLHLVGDDRRLLVGLADHHPGGVHELAVSHHPHHELGDVDVDVELPEVVRQPAPALHVQEDQPRLRRACSLLMLLVEQAPRARPHMPVRQYATGFLEVLNGGVHRSVEYRLLAAILDRNVETLAEKCHLLIARRRA